MKTFLFLGLTACLAMGQGVSSGFKIGLPITDALGVVQGTGGSFTDTTRHILWGGTIQFNLPGRFAIEIDTLDRVLRYNHTVGTTTTTTTAYSLEFPLLAKWAILPGPVRPFIDGGAAFRYIISIDSSAASVPELNSNSAVGLVAGAGVEFRLGKRARLSPELRYTHWGKENFRDPVNALLHTNVNQGDFLLGITF